MDTNVNGKSPAGVADKYSLPSARRHSIDNMQLTHNNCLIIIILPLPSRSMPRSEFFCALKLCAPFGRDAALPAGGHIAVWTGCSSAFFLHLEGKFECNLHAKRHTFSAFSVQEHQQILQY